MKHQHPRVGSKRTPCPRTLLASGPVGFVEATDCGLRELTVGGVTLTFDQAGFDALIETLQRASFQLAARSTNGSVNLFGSSCVSSGASS